MDHPFRSSSLAFTLIAIALVAVGCEHAGPLEAEPAAPTLTSIQQSTFNVSCAVSGCHLGGGAAAQLDLSAGSSFANLVGVASGEVPSLLRVEAGNPDDSYLVQKVEGTPGIVGLQMPRDRDPLSSAQIQAIRDWIEAGAAND